MKSNQRRMKFATALGAAALIAGMGLTVSSAWLITMASQHPPLMVLGVCIVMVRFFGITRSAARYGERIVSHESIFRKLTHLRVSLFNVISSRSLTGTENLNSGEFVKSIVDDVERAQEYQLRVLLPRSAAIVSVAFAVVIGFWIHPTINLVLIPISLILLFMIPSWASQEALTFSEVIEDQENSYAHTLSDLQFGLLEAKLFGYQDQILSEVRTQERKLQVSENSLLKKIRTLQFLAVLSIGGAITGICAIVNSYAKTWNMAAVTIAMAIFLPLVAFEGITNWYPNLFISGKLLRAQKNVDSLVERKELVQKRDFATPAFINLTLRNVCVSWGKKFMNPVDAEVSVGELLVIRGKSGSGKSTLAMGLTGLLPYTGSAAIGGIEISQIEDLSQYVSASLQHGHIFNTTVRENLRIAAPEAFDQEILEILKLVELETLSLDETLGEFGRPISGGEAKRLGVARALLSRARIVILDEPTEHLDSALALRLEERITSHCRERVLVVITHSGWAKSSRTVLIERE